MAGYFLYSLDTEVFHQLTTSPTIEQAKVFAEYFSSNASNYLEVFHWKEAVFPELIQHRLALSDWYLDLSQEASEMWDEILFSLMDEPGQTLGIDFQCNDYECIDWDCAAMAAEQGATMMAETQFGASAYRYNGTPSYDGYYPMYSFYLPEQCRELLSQLESVESHFLTLPDEEYSPREEFFEGLLPAVKNAVSTGRILWIQTDT